jgi:anti-sigma factor RsiW
MIGCSQEPLIDRYHDGEMDDPSRHQVEQHLKQCDSCVRHLADLRFVSCVVGTVELEPMTLGERFRTERFVASLNIRAGESALIRMAAGLAALAASVLLITSLCLAGVERSDVPSAQSVAILIPSDVMHSVQENANPNLSHWMVRNLGGDLP